MRLDRAAQGLEQIRHRLVGRGRQHHVARRQALVIHAPAVVDEVIEGDLDDPRGRSIVAEERAQGTGEVDPVEAENEIGLAQRGGRLFDRRDGAGRAGMERMIGRECRALFEVGDDAGAERFGKRHARVPRGQAARDSSGKNHRPLCGA